MKPKSRLLVVTTSYPLEEKMVGGVFVRHLNRSLEQYFDVCTVTPGGRSNVKQKGVIAVRYGPRPLQVLAQQPGGIPVAVRKNPLVLLLLPFMALSMFVVTALQLARSDYVVSHWTISGVLTGVVNLFFRKPSIVVLHGSDANVASKFWLGRVLLFLCMKLNKRCIAVSSTMGEEVRSAFPGVKERVFFLPNGVCDEYLHKERILERDVFRFLMVANLNPMKGVGDAIGAFAQLKESGVAAELVIVGEGPQRNELEAMADAMGARESVKFVGAIDNNEIAEYYLNSDALVLPSYSEGRSSVIQEAMAFGLPILCSDILPNKELVKEGVNGFLFGLGDTKEIFDRMKFCVNNKAKLGVIGLENRRYIEGQGLTWSAVAAKYKELLSS